MARRIKLWVRNTKLRVLGQHQQRRLESIAQAQTRVEALLGFDEPLPMC
jgi:hypothetical protein